MKKILTMFLLLALIPAVSAFTTPTVTWTDGNDDFRSFTCQEDVITLLTVNGHEADAHAELWLGIEKAGPVKIWEKNIEGDPEVWWDLTNLQLNEHLDQTANYYLEIRAYDEDDENDPNFLYFHYDNALCNQAPEALFDIDPSRPFVDDEIVFDGSESNDIDGEIVKYEWDLGTGSFFEGNITATKTFDTEGSKTIKLKVTDDDGATNTKTKYVYVKEKPSYKDFEVEMLAEPTEGEVPLSVEARCDVEEFGEGKSAEYRIDWDFGNGNALPNWDGGVIVWYEEEGIFNLTCTVTQLESNIVKEAFETITVTEPSYETFEANVEVTPNEGLVPLDVVGTCEIESNNDGLPGTYNYFWDVGDGETYETQNITHTFTEVGDYDIVCKITQTETNESEEGSDDVLVNEEEPVNHAPEASMTVSPNPAYVGDLLTFDASESSDVDGDNLTFYWHIEEIYEGPGPAIMQFVVEEAGEFWAEVYVSDGKLRDDDIKEFEVLEIVYEGFDVEADIIPRNGNAPLDVVGTCEVISKENGEPATYEFFWDMGDGTTYDTEDVEHTYTEVGDYTASCTVTQVETEIDETDYMVAYVEEEEIDYQDFVVVGTIFNNEGYAPLNVHSFCSYYAIPFTGESATYERTVDYGDGTVNDEAYYTNTYTEVGTYTYTCSILQVETGIRKSVIKQVIVSERPEENLPPVAMLEGPASAYVNEEVTYSASGSYDYEGEDLYYVWYVNGEVVKEGTDDFLTVKLSEAKEYSITVKVSDPEELSDTASLNTLVKKKVLPQPTPKPEKDDHEFKFAKIGIVGHDVNRVHAGQKLYVTIGTDSDSTKGRPSLIVPELGIKATGQLNKLKGRESMTASLFIPPDTPKGYYMLRIGFKSEEVRKGEIRWFKVE